MQYCKDPRQLGSGGRRAISSCREPSPNNALHAPRQANLAHRRRRRLVERLIQISPRLIEELLRHRFFTPTEAQLEEILSVHAAIDPKILHALGTDKFPGPPIVVRR